MADEKNVTLEQFKDFMTKADERLDKLEVGKENKVSPVSITIPTEGRSGRPTRKEPRHPIPSTTTSRRRT